MLQRLSLEPPGEGVHCNSPHFAWLKQYLMRQRLFSMQKVPLA
jgi:hypothetical protein